MWLVDQVGEGQIFTKSDMRSAFPDIEQIDRRMRELRAANWVIHTNRQDASLRPSELRLVSVGDLVWEGPGAIAAQPRLTAAARRAALRRCDYRCVRCGISAGETFADPPAASAILSVRIGSTITPDADADGVILCQRCFGDAADADLVEEVLGLLGEIDDDGRATLSSWLDAGKRTITPAERVWQRLAKLSERTQAAIRSDLAASTDAAERPRDGGDRQL